VEQLVFVIVQHLLPLIPSSPRHRLYPPACKPYGLEAEPEATKGGGIFVDDISIFPPP